MLRRLNGDGRVSAVGDTLAALIRMTRFTSFIPTELQPLFTMDSTNIADGFHYFNITM